MEMPLKVSETILAFSQYYLGIKIIVFCRLKIFSRLIGVA